LFFGAGDTLAASDEALGSAPLRSPKKRGPFQLVPVLARAMVERTGIGRLAPDIAVWNDRDSGGGI
jgi:hypothetical protein